MSRRAIYLAAAIVIVKIGLFAYLATVSPKVFINDDTPSYVDTLPSMIHEFRFYAFDRPEILRTPGYPLFLVPFAALLGDGGVNLSIPVHFFLALFTAFLVYKITKTLVGDTQEKAPVLAFFIVMLDPALVVSEFSLMSEVLFNAVFVSGMYMVLTYTKTGRAKYYLAGAFIIAISVYIRPAAMYANYLLAGVILIYGAALRNKKAVAVALAAVFINYAVTAVWVNRNHNLTGEKFFTTATAYNLYYMMGAYVLAKAEGKPFALAQEELLAKVPRLDNDEIKKLAPAEGDLPPQRVTKLGIDATASLAAQKYAINILLAHPLATAGLIIKGALANAVEPGTSGFVNMFMIRERGGMVQKFLNMPLAEFLAYTIKNEAPLIIALALGGIWIATLWFCFGWGVKTVGVSHGIAGALLLGVIAYYLIIAAGPHSLARYRAPAVPFIAVYAGVGIARAWEKLAKRYAHMR